jgi:hypothetical protein
MRLGRRGRPDGAESAAEALPDIKLIFAKRRQAEAAYAALVRSGYRAGMSASEAQAVNRFAYDLFIEAAQALGAELTKTADTPE